MNYYLITWMFVKFILKTESILLENSNFIIIKVYYGKLMIILLNSKKYPFMRFF